MKLYNWNQIVTVFLSRKENNLALKFLIEDIDNFNNEQEVSSVSLNIDQRQNERDTRSQQNKERREKRLKELGYKSAKTRGERNRRTQQQTTSAGAWGESKIGRAHV